MTVRKRRQNTQIRVHIHNYTGYCKYQFTLDLEISSKINLDVITLICFEAFYFEKHDKTNRLVHLTDRTRQKGSKYESPEKQFGCYKLNESY